MFEQIDAYCERLGPGLLAEPLNAVTNLAFIVAAILMWRRSAGVEPARILSGIIFAIGVGSFLFHTFATGWAALTDVVPIAAFILVYLFLVHRDVVGLSTRWSLFATAGFLPFCGIIVPLLDQIPFLQISNFYWTVPILLVIYASLLFREMPATAKGMWIGAALLCVSISLRSVDAIFCHVFPIGTHIFWHLLNAVMLAWMIEVYLRHVARS